MTYLLVGREFLEGICDAVSGVALLGEGRGATGQETSIPAVQYSTFGGRRF
jgi:hypothetical protein